MKTFWGSLAGALFICAALLTPAKGTVVIRNDPGGIINNFVAKYTNLQFTGEPVVIDGECDSACTLVTGLLPKRQVCVTPKAVLGFHSAWTMDTKTGKNLGFSKSATAELMRIYPPAVKRLLRKHGWNGRTPHPDLINIKGAELRSIIPACS